MRRDRRPAFRTVEGWARSILLEAGAIRECESHGWIIDRTDPHARELAITLARQTSAFGLTPDAAAAAIEQVLTDTGDTCPECA